MTVDVTDAGTFRAGNYRIEGMLEDEFGKIVAYNVSDPQPLVIGTNTMTLEFDGKMIYDQLPLTGSRSLKLVAVSIFTGNLSPATQANYVPITGSETLAYDRSIFEPSSPAANLFQDDMEGTSKWTAEAIWTPETGVWHSWNHSWKASSSSTSGTLGLASPLDLSNYTNPVLRFTAAYRMGANDEVALQASIDGTSWATITTYTGSTAHWSTQFVDLSAYRKAPNVLLRFNAQTQNGILFYLDDVYLNAWPAVLTAGFTYLPTNPIAGADTTFTGSYTAPATMAVIYNWDYGDGTITPPTTSPTNVHNFANFGDYTVTLTVHNPYDSIDSATKTQTVHVITQEQYYLTVNVNPADGGSVTRVPDRETYSQGEDVTLTASPSIGYTFAGWSGGGCIGSGACVVTMNSDQTVTATFTLNQYELTVDKAGTGVGTVTSVPAGIDCGATCSADFDYNTNVTLTAISGLESTFAGWSGSGCTGTGTCTIAMNMAKSVTATFILNQYTLTVSKDGNGTGTVTSEPVGIDCGGTCAADFDYDTDVTLTAVNGLESTFSGWSIVECPGTGSCTVTMNQAKDVTATFTLNKYTLTVNKDGTGTGTVTSEPAGIDCGSTCFS